ncbi:FadR family transcriptional regulator [Caldimonas thermodepolymerans]|jgi:Transcriptional regulators|uniref:GntR family transcriptional regulator n=1 Tax=Caldimonas thermodepolymerans TaxID=215580 RepID=A0A2S5T8K9_9BURK|nr:FadR/GntR family transcriptional regulator [Caldimonas thermodepolymerans]PPE71208.1 GntR family transcriptional regulator [Caldimonas thermodepolymerans]QPC32381.1 FadR family transcriptional regulator [Caldimonas thermodepolymerans]RDH98762.1 GntR family transcriptional repressor for pyruvate dehydrogenase complex [Caldimonas thermodepolymerans]TCP06160.1 GntR family transcriptional repressor for pyruvate dehydrogenase complex [Caldimonas thermodepolymerans]UZG48927.1 FadR family transcri
MTREAAAEPLLTPHRLSDRLAEWLRQRIEQGALRPGERLPTEQELAEQHGVSRTVVREAVSRLRSMGLLVSRQGSGVYVAPLSAARPLAFDPAVLNSLEAVLQVVEVRRALEGEVAALAAQRATPEDLQRIRAALAAIDEASAAGRDGVEEDLRFHRAIAEATGNPQFRLLLGFLEQYQRDAMKVTRANEATSELLMDEARREHHELAEAILRRDAAAAREAAIRHMVNAARRIEEADADVRAALRAALQAHHQGQVR